MRSQGSLEYLLIFAAILAIAVVVVIIATQMLSPGEEAATLQADKYTASLAGIEFPDYVVFYDGSAETAPTTLIYKGDEYPIEHTGTVPPTVIEIAQIGDDGEGNPFQVFVEEGTGQAYLGDVPGVTPGWETLFASDVGPGNHESERCGEGTNSHSVMFELGLHEFSFTEQFLYEHTGHLLVFYVDMMGGDGGAIVITDVTNNYVYGVYTLSSTDEVFPLELEGPSITTLNNSDTLTIKVEGIDVMNPSSFAICADDSDYPPIVEGT